MAQHLKQELRARIHDAALRVFAREGFAGATMAGIARTAGVSTGNLYLYWPSKDDLFHAVLPDAFIRRFLSLVRRRVTALAGVDDLSRLGPDAAFHGAAETLMSFCIEHRLQIVILLGRSGGTDRAGFAAGFVRSMQRLATGHLRSLDPMARPSPAMRVALDQIYRNWMRAMVEILENNDSAEGIREAAEAYSRYHMAGLRHLLAQAVHGA